MAQSSTAQQIIQQYRVPRLHLVLAFITFILIGCNDGALGVLIPDMRAFYRIDAATLSWLFFASTTGYLSASFNSGLLMAKLGERRFLLLSLVIFSLGAILYSLRPPYAFFLCAGAMAGFGVGMIDAGLNAYVASLPRSTTLLNYLHAFYGIGALLGPLVASGLLSRGLGWQTVYLVWLALALLILLGMWFAFKRRELPVQSSQQEAKPQEGNVLLATLHLRVVWLAALFLLFYVGTEVGLGNWSYSFLTLARSGLPLFSAWIVSGYWCGLTLGRLVLANLVSRLGVYRLITLCLSGVVVGILLAWVLPGLWGAACGLWLVGFCLGPLFPTIIALMPQLVPARLLPTAIGFLACLGSGGGALFPWLAGNLIQHVGYWFLLPFVFVLTVVMFGIWLMLNYGLSFTWRRGA
jgi:fucose permease